ncbi:MAG: hypothetical protein HY648_03980 [Acidobacteria bacterium]|nr:hypothetical protein [Acidobacteriota bacterium]
MSQTKSNREKKSQARFGIGEWYGFPLTVLSPQERRRYAEAQFLQKSNRPSFPCPFQQKANCNKPGGVCSLRLYERFPQTGEVKPATGELGQLRTVCPARFEEGGAIYRWLGETVLGFADPMIIGEIGFLESPPSAEIEAVPSEVGRIDKVLVIPNSRPLAWCALEVQAVYFQGSAMSNDFALIRHHPGDSLPFPTVLRRPDYRSSGPKRLMPQLQIKVPSLRRWGKKMIVVVDRSFFLAMGKMRTVPHISNCDVAWFIVKYEETGDGRFRLVPDQVQFTTLEDSVEGLTAGVPVSLETFESRIIAKLQRPPGPPKVAAN